MTDHLTAYNDWHRTQTSTVNCSEIWYRRVVENSDPSRDFHNRLVLEIGCGRGGFAVWLASQSYAPSTLVAADFSPEAIRQGHSLAQSTNVSTINWCTEDITRLTFEDCSFDTVISCETIEHVLKPARAVSELARVLRPNGRLFLTCPNYLNLFGAWRCYRRVLGRPYTEAGQPINRFLLLPQTIAWVRSAGLIVESFGSDEFLIPRFRKPPAHLALSKRFKYFGLQSWIVAHKPNH